MSTGVQELDENQEYVEQEDEFDINEKPAPVKEGDQEDAEDEEVEVITRERLPVFSSDEEDEGREGSEEPLYWLPAVGVSGQNRIGQGGRAYLIAFRQYHWFEPWSVTCSD